MMYTSKILTASAALLAIAYAVPLHHKREMVVVTKTQEVIVTIPITRTVWLGAGETAATDAPATSEQTASTSAASSVTTIQSPSILPSAGAISSSVVAIPKPSVPAPAPVSPQAAPVVSPITEPTALPSTSSVAIPSPVLTKSTASTAPAPVATTTNAAPSSTVSTAGVVDDVTHGPAAAGSSYVGDLTYYTPGMGACGIVNTEADHIVAISEAIFDVYTPNGNPNANPLCKQYVEITGADGNIYTGQITDRCVGCDAGSLDLTETFFNLVTKNGDGRVHNIHWQFASAT